jgi:predicted aspartyl protease
MGVFTVPIEVGDLGGNRFESLDALVDMGDSYLVVPRPVLVSLGVEASERRPFTLADGIESPFDLGDALLRLDGRTHPVLKEFGEAGTRALLGTVALETFGLQVDPVRQRLVPVSGLLMHCLPSPDRVTCATGRGTFRQGSPEATEMTGHAP